MREKHYRIMKLLMVAFLAIAALLSLGSKAWAPAWVAALTAALVVFLIGQHTTFTEEQERKGAQLALAIYGVGASALAAYLILQGSTIVGLTLAYSVAALLALAALFRR